MTWESIKAFFGFFNILPGWVYAALLAGAVGHSCIQEHQLDTQKVATATAQRETAQVRQEKSDLIAAAAQTVTAAVTAARAEERAAYAKLQGETDDLRKKNAIANSQLVAVTQRLYAAIAASDPFASCQREPSTGSAPGGTQSPARAQFDAAGRGLVDGILQLLSEGDQAIRERNLCVSNTPQ